MFVVQNERNFLEAAAIPVLLNSLLLPISCVSYTTDSLNLLSREKSRGFSGISAQLSSVKGHATAAIASH